MSDKTLKYIVASVIAMLLVFQIGTLISGFFGMAWGVVSAVVVIAISFFSARLARASGKNSAWFLLPTLLFTVIPIIYMIWTTMIVNTTWIDRLVNLTPFMISFGAPIILLLVVYYELRKRTFRRQP
ncbi:MAG: hypothetical protein V4563_08910 [Pseudomonadota bacterium]